MKQVCFITHTGICFSRSNTSKQFLFVAEKLLYISMEGLMEDDLQINKSKIKFIGTSFFIVCFIKSLYILLVVPMKRH